MAGNSSLRRPVYRCSDTTAGVHAVLVYLVVKLLLAPLPLLVLCLGFRWRRRRRRRRLLSCAAASHSDVFAYHSSAVGLIFVFGATFYICGKCAGCWELMSAGYYLCCIGFPGQNSFHMLTCVERYLAVVHPVLYRGQRQSAGAGIRNVSIGCVWLLCLGWIGVTALFSPEFPYIPCFCFSILALAEVSFCSLSVLCVLIRPGPGEVGGNRAQVDQSKQRAFHAVSAILAVLWLCVLGFLVRIAVDSSYGDSSMDGCLALTCGNFVSLPSAVVLPLLFLQRAGKLPRSHSC